MQRNNNLKQLKAMGRCDITDKNIMKRKFTLAVIALAMIILSSCASTGKYYSKATNTFETQTQVVLSEANFRVVKNVKTVILYNQKYKFDKNQLFQSAYNALREEAGLVGAQTLINVTIEEIDHTQYSVNGNIKNTKQAILVSGTVIEFTK